MTRDPRELRGAWRRFQDHRFDEPSPDLAGVVAHYWTVTWDYTEPYRQLIVPYPNVHLTVRGGVVAVAGVSTTRVVRVLEGRGSVVGVAFRPGCFRPFLGQSVSTITDRMLPAAAVFGTGVSVLAGDVSGPLVGDVPGPPVATEVVEAFLRTALPDPDPRADEAASIVGLIAASPALTRVDALAREVGLGVRQIQRLFAEYVGVGPKWVIRRYRLHEVTETMAAGRAVDWAALAADLGYADQSHFARDFTAMVGEPPTRYAQRY